MTESDRIILCQLRSTTATTNEQYYTLHIFYNTIILTSYKRLYVYSIDDETIRLDLHHEPAKPNAATVVHQHRDPPSHILNFFFLFGPHEIF